MAEVYSIGAAALAAGRELGATIESAAEKRDKAFQDFDVKYNLTSTMEETVSDTLQPVYRQAAQAALNEAQEAATALEADPNNADLRARVRAAQRQYDEIKNIGVARTAQDNKTRQMIRNGEIEDMAGSIEENLAKMDEMSSMNGKTITMEGGTVMITNPDGSKTPMLGSAYGDVQGVFTPAVMSPASKYNPSLVGTKMNYKKYKLTEREQRKLARSRNLYDTEQAYERALTKEEAKSSNLPNLNFSDNEDGTHTITGLTRTKVMVTEDLAENIPALRDKFGATRGEQLSVVGGTLDDNTRKFTSIVITPADRSHNGGKDIEVDAEYIARAMAEKKNESDFTPYMEKAKEALYKLGAAVNNTSSTLAKGQPLDIIEETFSVSRGNSPSQSESSGGINLSHRSEG
jgi:hypothetical protein